MVSKASEDLPEPDRPVNTTSWSRGMATSMFLRLCSRAPRIAITRASPGFLPGTFVHGTLARAIAPAATVVGSLGAIIRNVVRTGAFRQSPRGARIGGGDNRKIRRRTRSKKQRAGARPAPAQVFEAAALPLRVRSGSSRRPRTMLALNVTSLATPQVRRAAGRLAEIDIEIFDLGRPGAHEGVFDAAAGGPTDLRLRSPMRRRAASS